MEEPSAITILFYSYAAIAGASFLVSFVVAGAVFWDTNVMKYARRKARREVRRNDNQPGADNSTFQLEIQAPSPASNNQTIVPSPSCSQLQPTFSQNTLPPPYQPNSEYLDPLAKAQTHETESQPAHLTRTRIQSHPLPENPIYESISIARRREQQQYEYELYAAEEEPSTDGDIQHCETSLTRAYDQAIKAASSTLGIPSTSVVASAIPKEQTTNKSKHENDEIEYMLYTPGNTDEGAEAQVFHDVVKVPPTHATKDAKQHLELNGEASHVKIAEGSDILSPVMSTNNKELDGNSVAGSSNSHTSDACITDQPSEQELIFCSSISTNHTDDENLERSTASVDGKITSHSSMQDNHEPDKNLSVSDDEHYFDTSPTSDQMLHQPKQTEKFSPKSESQEDANSATNFIPHSTESAYEKCNSEQTDKEIA